MMTTLARPLRTLAHAHTTDAASYRSLRSVRRSLPCHVAVESCPGTTLPRRAHHRPRHPATGSGVWSHLVRGRGDGRSCTYPLRSRLEPTLPSVRQLLERGIRTFDLGAFRKAFPHLATRVLPALDFVTRPDPDLRRPHTQQSPAQMAGDREIRMDPPVIPRLQPAPPREVPIGRPFEDEAARDGPPYCTNDRNFPSTSTITTVSRSQYLSRSVRVLVRSSGLWVGVPSI